MTAHPPPASLVQEGLAKIPAGLQSCVPQLMRNAVPLAPLRSSPEQLTAVLLRELRDAHAKLLEAMADLDTLTRGPVPPRDRVIDARWSISRASLARRTLWHSIHRHLAVRASEQETKELQRLYESDMTLLRSSSEHVAKWSITAVLQDWEDYCVASNAIRWKMKAAIGSEQRVLYPAGTAVLQGR